ncbi:uncharacterized protein TNCV_4850181 [Trichonephila clavipes]|nr:uncharacterized protein TNCV_4850181 [Trichonephila clavipes]
MCAIRKITDISAQPISDKATQLQITKKKTSTELFELLLNNDVIELIVIYAKFICCRICSSSFAAPDQNGNCLLQKTLIAPASFKITNTGYHMDERNFRSVSQTVGRALLDGRGNPLATLQRVPSHVGILGNERADQKAKQGAELPQLEVPLNLRRAKSIISTRIDKYSAMTPKTMSWKSFGYCGLNHEALGESRGCCPLSNNYRT